MYLNVFDPTDAGWLGLKTVDARHVAHSEREYNLSPVCYMPM